MKYSNKIDLDDDSQTRYLDLEAAKITYDVNSSGKANHIPQEELDVAVAEEVQKELDAMKDY